MKKTYILALISALLCGVLIYVFLGKAGKSLTEDEIPKVKIVVATCEIAPYTEISDDMLEVKLIPRGGEHEDAAKKIDEVVGLISSSTIVEGEQIILSKLSSPGGDVGNSLSYDIPEGMRAMTVAVSAVSGIDQHLVTGDRVDVLLNITTENADADLWSTGAARDVALSPSVTGILLEDIEIAALGSAKAQSGDSYTTATLLVTPEQSLVLFSAELKGSICLSLRGHGDSEPGNTDILKVSEILP